MHNAPICTMQNEFQSGVRIMGRKFLRQTRQPARTARAMDPARSQPMGKKELFDITVKLLHETPLAYRVDTGGKTDWVPKSQCELEPNGDGTHTLTAPTWLLQE